MNDDGVSVQGTSSRLPAFNMGYPSTTMVVGQARVRIGRFFLKDVIVDRASIIRVEVRGIQFRRRMWSSRLVFIRTDGRAVFTRFMPRRTNEAWDVLERHGWRVVARPNRSTGEKGPADPIGDGRPSGR